MFLLLHIVFIVVRPFLGDRIKCCILSVCLSVPYLLFSLNRDAVETSNLVETQRWTRVTGGGRGANLRSKVHCIRKCENRFCPYRRQKWVDLRQTKTKMINYGPFYTYRLIHFSSGKASF